MTTYARISGGFALDCQVATSLDDLKSRFHPEWLAAHPFVVVPDGTIHGAKDNGNGTFTNPPPPTPPTIDVELTRKDFRNHIVTALGGVGPGSAVLQGYLDVANASTATTQSARNMRLALEIFRNENSFTKTDAQQLMNAIQFTASDQTQALNTWPVKVL